MGHARIAGAENPIRTKAHIEFLLERRLDVDVGEHTEAVLSQRFDRRGNCRRKWKVDDPREMIRPGHVQGATVNASTMPAA